MAKTIEEKIDKVLEDFANLDILYINKALRNNKVSPMEFYKFLEDNVEYKNKYEQIDHYNNLYKEDTVSEKAYREANTNDKGLLGMMLKANNKTKYDTKQEVNHNHNFNKMSDDDINKEISKLLNK